jgi:limonene 1,2-monooxygenase
MAEAIEVIVRLFTETEPLTVATEWFEMHDAVLQLRPYTNPHPPLAFTSMESPAGMQLAGRYGAGVLSLAVAKGPRGPVDLAAHWRIAEQAAEQNGTSVSRSDWRLAIPVYVAESRKEALDDVREGSAAYLLDYAEAITGRTRPFSGPREQIVDYMVEAGSWIVGTPDDAIAAIEALQERSGGFGGLLVWANEWTTREKTLQSYEMIARHVAPRFQGALDGIFVSESIARSKSRQMNSARAAAVEKAQERFEAERES